VVILGARRHDDWMRDLWGEGELLAPTARGAVSLRTARGVLFVGEEGGGGGNTAADAPAVQSACV
jgi:hypothetical protein